MKWSEIAKALSMLTQIGLAMVVPIIFCIILGNFLDKKFQTDILFLIIFTVIGVISSFRTLYMMTVYKFKK